MQKRTLTVTIGHGDLGLIHSVWFPVDGMGQSNVSKVMLADGTVLDLTIVLGAERRADAEAHGT